VHHRRGRLGRRDRHRRGRPRAHAGERDISPEGCAAILWRDAGEARKAAAAFKPDAVHSLELGVIDGIVPEPDGGAHTDHDEAARLLGEALELALSEVEGTPADVLRRERRAKFRRMGIHA
jgi:acetyl-CoA carboxylase alpha subunit